MPHTYKGVHTIREIEDDVLFSILLFDVASPTVGRMGYDWSKRRLYVQLRQGRSRNGVVRRYANVPKTVYRALVLANRTNAFDAAFDGLVESGGYPHVPAGGQI
jgi:hypothetical protein